ncbi:MAG TPA: ATPase, T2SS/T4P/T4SS family, partial [Patescibacteria group bacterium]|nr:ATPase, T2SS/T4P/T4SS family [Patescibacteria group bacterium]
MPAIPTVDSTVQNGARTLADILYTQGALKTEVAEQVKLAEIQTGKSQEDIIKSQNLVSETQITKAKAELYNIPYIDLGTMPTSPEALAVLPQSVAQRFRAFPISTDKGSKTLNLAMADPLDLTAIEFIEQKTNLRVKPFAAEPDKVDDFIATRYTTSLSQEVTEALKEVAPEKEKAGMLELSKTGFIREERIAEIVTHVLDFAVRSRASDVHIEPQEKSTRVRYRIDGILQEKLTVPKALHEALISRIKILSGMKIDEKRIPQDGRFNFK